MTTNAIMRSPHLLPSEIAPASNGTYLTMDALLTYCESRMRGIDAQVQEQFLKQKQGNEASAALQNLMGSINACTAGGIQPGGRSAHDLIRAYQAAIMAVSDPALKQRLVAERDAFIKAVGKNGGAELRSEMLQGGDFWHKPLADNADGQMVVSMSGDTVKKFADNLKGLQTEVNQGSELGMITLQSLMSQRQMAIQLTTNLVQSLGEMTNKIAANIGR
jgi:hypothetical protein